MVTTGEVVPFTPRRPDGRTHIDHADFRVTDTMRRWAHQTYPGLDLDHETAQFLSHHRAEGTRRASWPDEWQKWIRRSAKWQADHPTRRTAPGSTADYLADMAAIANELRTGGTS